MKVGDYVRTDTGRIAKIKNIIDFGKENEFEYLNYNDVCVLTTESDYNYDVVGCRGKIIKSSPNIIDLIEVGDYVNGLPVESVCGTRWDENDLRVWLAVATKYKKEYGVENSEGSYEFETLYRCIKPENIKSIVTKEQFESMEYRIGE